MFFTKFGQFQVTPAWLLWVLSAYFVLPCTIYLTVPFFIRRNRAPTAKTVAIFVFGDLGHSPRMCYHALSFARLGYSVNLCGYLETDPPDAVLDDDNVDIVPIKVVHNKRRLPYLVFAALKIWTQIGQIWRILDAVPGCSHMVLQNPPALPLLAVLLVYIRVCSPQTKLVIDWHNLNFSILNLRYQNEAHWAVRLMRFYEKTLGRSAWLHITVTDAMKQFLVTDFGFSASKVSVLHDRPGPQFKPIANISFDHSIYEGIDMTNRRVLVSSTSFTADEDFASLVHALKAYDSSSAPPLLVVVTGKGPLKEDFLESVRQAEMRKVKVRSAWLSSEDYPLVLAAADLAVSLHTSSSGLDLPMKILDFFGVGVPVVTLDFPAIGELVTDGVNGIVTSPSELHTAIIEAMSDANALKDLKAGALRESENRWEENWAQTLGPIFEKN